MSTLKFGTSGLRGLVTDLVGQPTYDYTRAFLTALRSELDPGAPILIGRDLRFSSPGIARTVASAVAAAGFEPLDCGDVPTPALALESVRLGRPAVMVTGSHIPDDRNGLKFYTARGEITKDEEAAIIREFAQCDMSSGEATPHPDAARRFFERYTEAFAPDALAGLRVGVYQHSTVVRDLLVDLIAALGGTPIPFGRSARFTPVDTEAHRPEDLAAIRKAAADTAVDAVVSADGDGDRPLLADADGTVIAGDAIGTIAARQLGVTAVAVPVTANSAIEATAGFSRVIRTRIGSPFVIAGMDEARREGCTAIAGFEANGGFLLGSDILLGDRPLAALPTRDSILPLLAVLAAVRARGTTVAALAARLAFKATASHRLQQISSARSRQFLGRLGQDGSPSSCLVSFLAPLGRVAALDDLDGIRVSLVDGSVIHFRASGNAPELRCYAEARSSAEAERIVDWGLRAADAFLSTLQED